MGQLFLVSKDQYYTIKLLFLIYFLTLLDYSLTFIGINIFHIITEANPIMVKFMTLPFYKGLVLKSIFSLFPLLLLEKVKSRFLNIDYYYNILILILSIVLYPNVLHMIWLLYI
ncbi:DUF5658 family protein [Dethiothermospora halolimnae]|uniref:DUF5658 family protein n=1 Tax=Dethiothermospora halolimnae TaxID=3114390 RepID=UPI003CCBB69B